MRRYGKAVILFCTLLILAGSILYLSSTWKKGGQDNLNGGGAAEDRPLSNSSYDAGPEIASALKRLEKGTPESSVISGVKTVDKVIAITFEGMADQKTEKKLLELLKTYNVKTTFFLPGIKAAEDPDIVKTVSDSGQAIGNYTLNADKRMELLPKKEIAENLSRTSVILGNISGEAPALLKCNLTSYTDDLLRAADASGLKAAVKSDYYLNYQSFPSEASAAGFVRKLAKGSIISIKVDSILDKSEYDIAAKPTVKGKAANNAAADPGPGLDEKKATESDKDESLIKSVDYLLKALSKENFKIVPADSLSSYAGDAYSQDYKTELENNNGRPALVHTFDSLTVNLDTAPADYQAKRILNSGKKAIPISKLYTTEPSVAYVFRGVSDKTALDSVLKTLKALNAKATFFVTGKEILDFKANVDEIVKSGNQLANGGYGMGKTNPGKLDFNAACYEIDMGERILKAYLGSRYDVKANKLYMPLFADTGGVTLEASKAMGYDNVVTYNVSAMSGKYKDLSADEIVQKYFANTVALQRGDIVYFRLDYLTGKNAINNLVYETAVDFIKKAPYNILPVGEMISNKLVYVPASRSQAAGSGLIKDTYGYSEDTLFSMVRGNYIGNPYINTGKVLIGFSDEEISNIDVTGKINTDGKKVIFLTFDDWGYDDNITQLLNDLRKYNVKATFFVRVGTGSLSYDSSMLNPNLLRAIALDGHDIGDHTFTHMNVNISTAEEKAALRKDIVTANKEMSRYIGDTGRLKSFFRPPTLAVSKLGLETVFDSGFKYIINGDFSTHDYEAKSARFLISKLINGINTNGADLEVTKDTLPGDIMKIKPGSVVVMHMSENAKYTPEALNTVIPYYLQQGYQFARLSDYLKY